MKLNYENAPPSKIQEIIRQKHPHRRTARELVHELKRRECSYDTERGKIIYTDPHTALRAYLRQQEHKIIKLARELSISKDEAFSTWVTEHHPKQFLKTWGKTHEFIPVDN